MIFISFFVFFFALLMTKTMTSTITPRINLETLSPPDVTNHPNLRLLDPMCGPVTLRVTDDSKTGVSEFPWMALLMSNIENKKTKSIFYCDGTIISSRYILTAVQCVRPDPSYYRLISVRVGDHDLNTERDCDKNENGEELECAEKYQEFGVESVHYHPEYSRKQKHNDIALIRLNSTIDFKPLNVKPICLPYGTAANLSQRKTIVSGWGKKSYFDNLEINVLLQEIVPLVPHEQCNEVYKQFNKTILHKQLCVKGLNYTTLCLRNVGGPLQASSIYNGRSVRTVQYGVLSYRTAWCGTPDVYTKVAYYMDWILDTMTD